MLCVTVSVFEIALTSATLLACVTSRVTATVFVSAAVLERRDGEREQPDTEQQRTSPCSRRSS
jgi:hypothetical protein